MKIVVQNRPEARERLIGRSFWRRLKLEMREFLLAFGVTIGRPMNLQQYRMALPHPIGSTGRSRLFRTQSLGGQRFASGGTS
jgi:hypothetical protein